MDNQDIPFEASLIIDISQACKMGFELVILFVHFVRAEKGLKEESLEVKTSKDFFSVEIIEVTA